VTPEVPETRAAAGRRLAGRWAPAASVVVALAIASAIVIPRMQADGNAHITSYELDAGQPAPGLHVQGSMERNVYGFVVGGFGAGATAFDVTVEPRPGERTVLVVSGGGGPGVSSELSLIDQSGIRHVLGRPVRWRAHAVDISTLTRGGQVRLEFAATNERAAPALIADRVQVVSYPPDAIPRASRWEVAAWVALCVLLALVALRRLRRDGVLVAAAGLLAFVVWPAVKAGALEPLSSNLWDSAVGASWFGLDKGLVSGTFGDQSALAVQLFHALTPVTGTGAGGARIASMIVGVLALVAIYALGRRVAGPVGAATAVTCALLADTFRLGLSSADSTGALVIAACLFLLAVHGVLRHAGRGSMIALGAAGAIAILAQPLWWPGVLAAIVLLALRYAPSGGRRAALGAALLVLVLVSLPSRISVAHQADGDLNADVIELATVARNIEFVGRGKGAPPDSAALSANPSSGPQVGLGDYVLGDHSLTVVAGGALSGGYDGLSAAAQRPETKIVGLLAFIIELAGVVYLLLLPRLRLLVAIPALLALVPWFFTSRGAAPPFAAGTAFWPALLLGAATVGYAVREATRERIAMPPFVDALRNRVSAAGRRAGRPAEPV
jgi:hypothetical protein